MRDARDLKLTIVVFAAAVTLIAPSRSNSFDPFGSAASSICAHRSPRARYRQGDFGPAAVNSITRLADSVTVYSPVLQQSLAQLHARGLSDQAAAGALTEGLVSQSYLLSSLDIFYLSGWLCLALIPLCFLVPRPAGGGWTNRPVFLVGRVSRRDTMDCRIADGASANPQSWRLKSTSPGRAHRPDVQRWCRC